MNGLLDPLIILAAGVVMVRCICVLWGANRRTHKRGGLHFLAFGASYILLAATAFNTALAALEGAPALNAVGFLFASAGLILFDRRERRDHRS